MLWWKPTQPPKDWWQASLRMFLWACRTPIALFLVWTSSCIGFLAGMFIARATVWIYQHYLSHWW